jgi:hypothetical protein
MGLPALAALMLSLFSGVLLASRAAAGRRAYALISGAFVAGVLLASWFNPGNTVSSLVAGGAIAWTLLGSPRASVPPVLSGLVAGLGVATVLPVAAGWTVLAIWLLALLAVLASARLSGERPQFAPVALLDQGSCALLIAAPLIAALPAAQSGWKSALALAGASASAAAPAPGWWLALPVIALICGALRQWWFR